jgi:hypothetical protein
MTDEDAKARELYEAAKDDFDVFVGWENLPEIQKAYWRELAKGNAGASLG